MDEFMGFQVRALGQIRGRVRDERERESER